MTRTSVCRVSLTKRTKQEWPPPWQVGAVVLAVLVGGCALDGGAKDSWVVAGTGRWYDPSRSLGSEAARLR